MELAWEARWTHEREGRPTTRLADEDPPNLLFTDKALKRHEGLTKAQSSLLTQARTGDIGLRNFLFKIGVPETATPYCECGKGRRQIRSHRDLHLIFQGAGTQNGRLARKVLDCLVDSGRLPQYRLARRLALEQE